MLKCSDNSYYVGVTNNIERRIKEHEGGFNENSYTFKRRPIMLVWFERSASIKQAIDLEKQIKGWSRKKKEALINDDWNKIVELSNEKNIATGYYSIKK
ncbi:MAG: GIY-YIG nuclease family protein [Chitinophagales bacterium]